MSNNLPLTDSDLQIFITSQGVNAEIIHLSEPTPTVEDAAKALNVSAAHIIKSLVFIANEEPLLVIAAGEARISEKRLRDALGVSRRQLRMAKPDDALALSGFRVGAMPPFGHRVPLKTFIDSFSIDKTSPLLYGGGGTTSAMMRLSGSELFAATQGTYLPLTFSSDASD